MTKKILLAALILLVLGGIAFFYPGESDETFTLQKEAELLVIFEEQRISVSFDDILALEQYEVQQEGEGLDPDYAGVTHRGVKLVDLFTSLDIPLDEINQVITRSLDGYTVAFFPDEVLDEEKVYLVYAINGEPLSPMEEGGSGPYRIAVSDDIFRQRWNKNIAELEIR